MYNNYQLLSMIFFFQIASLSLFTTNHFKKLQEMNKNDQEFESARFLWAVQYPSLKRAD